MPFLSESLCHTPMPHNIILYNFSKGYSPHFFLANQNANLDRHDLTALVEAFSAWEFNLILGNISKMKPICPVVAEISMRMNGHMEGISLSPSPTQVWQGNNNGQFHASWHILTRQLQPLHGLATIKRCELIRVGELKRLNTVYSLKIVC